MIDNRIYKFELIKIKKFTRIFLLPILLIFTFFIILIFLLIPKVNQIIEKLNNIDSVKSDLELKKIELKRLIDISKNLDLYTKILNKINSQTSGGLNEVITFRNKITKIAIENNLTIKTQKLNELRLNDINQISQENENNITLLEVPSFFEIEGNYSDIINFLKSLSKFDELVLIKRMDLILKSKSDKQEKSSTSIEFTKFTFKYPDNSLSDQSLLFFKNDINKEIPSQIIQYFITKE